MNCQRVQELLLADPNEPLPAGSHAALQAHLAVCPVCRGERDKLLWLDQELIGWAGMAPIMPITATRARLGAPRARRQMQLRRIAGITKRATIALALRCAAVLALVLAIVSFGAALGVPQARTLVHLGLRPFGGGEPTLPVLPIVGDQIWVEAVSPASDARLSPMPAFQLQLGYTLVSTREALVSVRLADTQGTQLRYFATPVRVSAGTNRAALRFTIDDMRARRLFVSGEVQIEVTMRPSMGANEAPLLARTTYGRWQLP